MLEKTLESPLDCKEIQPVHSEDQPWDSFGRNDAKAETTVLWPLDVKNWLIWKDPDAGKDWRREEKGMTEDEMVGWNHWLIGHESEQALGVGDGQGSPALALLFCLTIFAFTEVFKAGFSSSQVWMWELDHKESWEPKD